MPRRKKNVLPKEELKFVEAPKYIYHGMSIPIVHQSTNPVTLKTVPVEDVCKKWVTPCFSNLDFASPSTSRARGKGKPRGRGAGNLTTDRNEVVRADSTIRAVGEVVTARRMPSMKPIVFRGMNNDISDIEDITDGESDECLVEGEEEGGGTTSRMGMGDLSGPAKSETPDCQPVKMGPHNHDNVDISDASVGDDEEMTFPEIITPEDSCSESPDIDTRIPTEKSLGPHVMDSALTPDPAEEPFSPQSLVSDTSQSMLREGSKVPSPRALACQSEHPSTCKPPTETCPLQATVEHLSPSFTRNPLPIFFSPTSSTDYSARSAEWFKEEFFDTPQDVRGRGPPLARARRRRRRSGDRDTPLSSPSLQAHSKSVYGLATPGCSPSEVRDQDIIAEDTPEEEQGLRCRVRQVRDRPKILRLVVSRSHPPPRPS